MAVPGFSVTELIQATARVKQLYDAFFSKHANSASRIRDLADDIVLFRYNLRLHQEIIDARGLDRNGYEAIKRTLDECTDFLNEYIVVLDGRKFSAIGAWKTAMYAYEGENARRLQERIRGHYGTLNFSMTMMSLKEHGGPSTFPVPLAMPDMANKTISPPRSPKFLSESPQTNPNRKLPLTSDNLQSSTNLYSQSLGGISTAGLATSEAAIRTAQESIQNNYRREFSAPDGLTDFNQRRQNSMPDMVLPQPALSYIVAKLYFGSKILGLRRRATGRDFDKGRELVIRTESKSPRLIHQIKRPANQACYPYTWHRRWEDHELEVTFKGIPLKHHSIEINGQSQSIGSRTPVYVLNNRQDYAEFQSQVRGKELVDFFEFGRIMTESSSKNGEATHQHLKIWKHNITQDFSISFYASAAEEDGDLEFPISMFNQDFETTDGLNVNLDFTIAMEPKRVNGKKTGRSGTWATTSSVASLDAADFSRTQRGNSMVPTVATTVTSGPSVGSLESTDGSPSQKERSKNSLTVLEALGKKMKYLCIEFSDKQEASRFKSEFQRAYKEELARLADYFDDWRMATEAAAAERAESIRNMSVSGTPPFSMSPLMTSQKSPILQQQL